MSEPVINLPFVYRAVLLYFEPAGAAVGALLLHFRPAIFLNGMAPVAKYAPNNQIIYDQLAATYILFAFNEAIILRTTNDMRMWRAILIDDWFNYLPPDSACELRYDGMKLGDNFLVVSPGAIILYTSDPRVISYICTRPEQFPKPLAQYAILNICGPNVITTEGPEWRIHRKVLSPSFNKKNSSMVFKEAVYQAKDINPPKMSR
ncbi:Hypothetical protein NCS54_01478200 [Fusarium falciforme]|uniref:Hypothetical protein n=1 Tax=Fusarium falciforme TaxID=195108 RepID=UPI0022FFD8FE|nr:Hypothetical protein NCS54_01478200 [Fusarium falciforme]WAO97076.1 Hypothetical protein NCS54_01478200 [Fusarium falciforme]